MKRAAIVLLAACACACALLPASSPAQSREHPFWGIGAWHWPCASQQQSQDDCIGAYHHALLDGQPMMYRFAVFQERWEDPAYGPRFYRRAAQYAAAAGMLPVFVLARADNTPKPHFAAFARDAARTLADVSPWFEVWNEPNGIGGRLTPQQFAYVLCEGVNGLTADGLPVRILTGGLAAHDLLLTNTPTISSVASYLRDTLNSLSGCSPAQFAGVSAHLYTTTPAWVAAQAVALRRALDDTAPAMDLWVTEFGWNSHDGEDTQAAHVRDASAWLAEHRDACAIAAVMPFAWQDSTDDHVDARIGLLRADRTPKPAWREYAARVAAPLPAQAPTCEVAAPAASTPRPTITKPVRTDVKRHARPCRPKASRSKRNCTRRHARDARRAGIARENAPGS